MPFESHDFTPRPGRRKTVRMVLSSLLSLVLCTFQPGVAANDDDRDDMEKARHLHALGTILSLGKLIEKAQKIRPGRVIDAALIYEDSHGRYVYEILILDRRGEIWELEFDAAYGSLIEHEPGGE
jgi:uncharacterized membrane protein YkoI